MNTVYLIFGELQVIPQVTSRPHFYDAFSEIFPTSQTEFQHCFDCIK